MTGHNAEPCSMFRLCCGEKGNPQHTSPAFFFLVMFYKFSSSYDLVFWEGDMQWVSCARLKERQRASGKMNIAKHQLTVLFCRRLVAGAWCISVVCNQYFMLGNLLFSVFFRISTRRQPLPISCFARTVSF